MRQFAYDTILACINHGAAAIAEPLINELNSTVQNEQKYVQMQNAAEQERKAKAEQEKKTAEQKILNKKEEK